MGNSVCKVLSIIACSIAVVAGIILGLMIVMSPLWMCIIIAVASGALLSAGMAGIFYAISHWSEWNWGDFGKEIGNGALQGALTGAIGGFFSMPAQLVCKFLNVTFGNPFFRNLASVAVYGVVGAVSNSLSTLIANIQTNEKWDRGLGKAALIGFIGGALGSLASFMAKRTLHEMLNKFCKASSEVSRLNFLVYWKPIVRFLYDAAADVLFILIIAAITGEKLTGEQILLNLATMAATRFIRARSKKYLQDQRDLRLIKKNLGDSEVNKRVQEQAPTEIVHVHRSVTVKNENNPVDQKGNLGLEDKDDDDNDDKDDDDDDDDDDPQMVEVGSDDDDDDDDDDNHDHDIHQDDHESEDKADDQPTYHDERTYDEPMTREDEGDIRDDPNGLGENHADGRDDVIQSDDNHLPLQEHQEALTNEGTGYEEEIFLLNSHQETTMRSSLAESVADFQAAVQMDQPSQLSECIYVESQSQSRIGLRSGLFAQPSSQRMTSRSSSGKRRDTSANGNRDPLLKVSAVGKRRLTSSIAAGEPNPQGSTRKKLGNMADANRSSTKDSMDTSGVNHSKGIPSPNLVAKMQSLLNGDMTLASLSAFCMRDSDSKVKIMYWLNSRSGSGCSRLLREIIYAMGFKISSNDIFLGFLTSPPLMAYSFDEMTILDVNRVEYKYDQVNSRRGDDENLDNSGVMDYLIEAFAISASTHIAIPILLDELEAGEDVLDLVRSLLKRLYYMFSIRKLIISRVFGMMPLSAITLIVISSDVNQFRLLPSVLTVADVWKCNQMPEQLYFKDSPTSSVDNKQLALLWTELSAIFNGEIILEIESVSLPSRDQVEQRITSLQHVGSLFLKKSQSIPFHTRLQLCSDQSALTSPSILSPSHSLEALPHLSKMRDILESFIDQSTIIPNQQRLDELNLSLGQADSFPELAEYIRTILDQLFPSLLEKDGNQYHRPLQVSLNEMVGLKPFQLWLYLGGTRNVGEIWFNLWEVLTTDHEIQKSFVHMDQGVNLSISNQENKVLMEVVGKCLKDLESFLSQNSRSNVCVRVQEESDRINNLIGSEKENASSIGNIVNIFKVLFKAGIESYQSDNSISQSAIKLALRCAAAILVLNTNTSTVDGKSNQATIEVWCQCIVFETKFLDVITQSLTTTDQILRYSEFWRLLHVLDIGGLTHEVIFRGLYCENNLSIGLTSSASDSVFAIVTSIVRTYGENKSQLKNFRDDSMWNVFAQSFLQSCDESFASLTLSTGTDLVNLDKEGWYTHVRDGFENIKHNTRENFYSKARSKCYPDHVLDICEGNQDSSSLTDPEDLLIFHDLHQGEDLAIKKMSNDFQLNLMCKTREHIAKSLSPLLLKIIPHPWLKEEGWSFINCVLAHLDQGVNSVASNIYCNRDFIVVCREIVACRIGDEHWLDATRSLYHLILCPMEEIRRYHSNLLDNAVGIDQSTIDSLATDVHPLILFCNFKVNGGYCTRNLKTRALEMIQGIKGDGFNAASLRVVLFLLLKFMIVCEPDNKEYFEFFKPTLEMLAEDWETWLDFARDGVQLWISSQANESEILPDSHLMASAAVALYIVGRSLVFRGKQGYNDLTRTMASKIILYADHFRLDWENQINDNLSQSIFFLFFNVAAIESPSVGITKISEGTISGLDDIHRPRLCATKNEILKIYSTCSGRKWMSYFLYGGVREENLVLIDSLFHSVNSDPKTRELEKRQKDEEQRRLVQQKKEENKVRSQRESLFSKSSNTPLLSPPPLVNLTLQKEKRLEDCHTPLNDRIVTDDEIKRVINQLKSSRSDHVILIQILKNKMNQTRPSLKISSSPFQRNSDWFQFFVFLGYRLTDSTHIDLELTDAKMTLLERVINLLSESLKAKPASQWD